MISMAGAPALAAHAAARSSAAGTTALTSPQSSAFCASYWRHRNQISRAFFWPTMRAM